MKAAELEWIHTDLAIGFKPEKGLGYGDFIMSPGVNYSLMLPGSDQIISDLTMEACPEDQGGQSGGWRITLLLLES